MVVVNLASVQPSPKKNIYQWSFLLCAAPRESRESQRVIMQQTDKVNRMRAVKFVMFAERTHGERARIFKRYVETMKEMDRRTKRVTTGVEKRDHETAAG